MRDMEQRSAEWFAIRCGKATASRIADVVARTRSGYSASRANYEAELIAERLTGQTASGYTNAAMQWGIDTEPEARAAYEFRHDCEVEEVGFLIHPRISESGASPDGLVSDDGMVEIKCPNTATHIDALLGGPIPAKYLTQMQWQMACAERQWCDFVSYDPRLPEAMRLHVERVNRDDEEIRRLEAEVKMFLEDVAAKVENLRSRYEWPKDLGVRADGTFG